MPPNSLIQTGGINWEYVVMGLKFIENYDFIAL
jgi:hypothetical protein